MGVDRPALWTQRDSKDEPEKIFLVYQESPMSGKTFFPSFQFLLVERGWRMSVCWEKKHTDL
jgi:hypothetical protein